MTAALRGSAVVQIPFNRSPCRRDAIARCSFASHADVVRLLLAAGADDLKFSGGGSMSIPRRIVPGLERAAGSKIESILSLDSRRRVVVASTRCGRLCCRSRRAHIQHASVRGARRGAASRTGNFRSGWNPSTCPPLRRRTSPRYFTGSSGGSASSGMMFAHKPGHGISFAPSLRSSSAVCGWAANEFPYSTPSATFSGVRPILSTTSSVAPLSKKYCRSSPRRDYGDRKCRPERRLVGVSCG